MSEVTESPFGPEYPKINGLYKRDARKVIIPDDYSEDVFDYLKHNAWTWTEKIDGTNIRLFWNGESVTVGGRTDRAVIPAKLLQTLDPLVKNTQLWAETFDCPATIYGEGYGAGIQSGGHYLPDRQDFIVFDIRIGRFWLRREDVVRISEKLGLRVVPYIGELTLSDAAEHVREGKLKSAFEGAPIEGIVGHPSVELRSRMGDRITAKIKVKDFEDYRRRIGAPL